MPWFDAAAPAGPQRSGLTTLWDEWPSVSIIVQARNEAAALESCVRSIRLTRYARYEVILVDNGSTDGTAAAMARLAAADPRLKVLGQPACGRGAARNLGIRHASGDVLLFADADALFSRDTVDRMLQGFEDKRTGAVCGDVSPVRANGDAAGMFAVAGQLRTAAVRKALTLIGGIPILPGSIEAVPRGVLAEIGPLREDTPGADNELVSLVRTAGYRVAFAPHTARHAADTPIPGAIRRQRVRLSGALLMAMGPDPGTGRQHKPASAPRTQPQDDACRALREAWA